MEAETTYAAILGAVLANLRTAKGLKQAQIAERLDLHVSTWSRIEKGEGPITAEQLRKAAELLGDTPANILAKAAVAEESAKGQGIKVEEKWSGATRATAMGSGAIARIAGAMVIPVIGPVLGALVGAAIAGVMHATERKASEMEPGTKKQ